MGYPVLVSEENGVVTGYASFGDWRNFDGFRHTVEHSVYVHPEHQGKGLGRALLSRLIDEARACGKHVMVAGLSLRIRHHCICTACWALKPPRKCHRLEPNLGGGWI